MEPLSGISSKSQNNWKIGNPKGKLEKLEKYWNQVEKWKTQGFPIFPIFHFFFTESSKQEEAISNVAKEKVLFSYQVSLLDLLAQNERFIHQLLYLIDDCICLEIIDDV